MSAIGEHLAHKYAGVPAYYWIGGTVAAAGGFLLWRRHQAANAAAAAGADTTDSGNPATPGAPTGADMVDPGSSAYGIPGPAGPPGPPGATTTVKSKFTLHPVRVLKDLATGFYYEVLPSGDVLHISRQRYAELGKPKVTVYGTAPAKPKQHAPVKKTAAPGHGAGPRTPAKPAR